MVPKSFTVGIKNWEAWCDICFKSQGERGDILGCMA